MNITKIKQAKIREFFIENSQEMKEVKQIKTKICNRIYDILLNSLNDSEKYLMGIDTVSYSSIGCISIDRSSSYNELFGFDFPTNRIKSYYWDEENHHYKEIYGIFSIFTFGKDKTLPKTINNSGIKGWEELSILNPKEFEVIKSDMKIAIELLNSLYYKISELSRLLNSTEIGLLDVKKYFPELYNIIKTI